ncbi:MAG TPA: sugar kinase [Caulobacteraceae bacterium]|nr:sugar kinase [Caulobacteraceae bacterium]
MVDLASEMAQLWMALGPPIPDRGRVITFVSATPGEGASTVAREFAAFAADRVRRNVWLVDMSLPESRQARAFLEERERYGALGREAAASPNGSAFFAVQPAMRGPDGRPWPSSRYLAAHQVAKRRLWVTRFRRELMRQGQSVSVTPGGEYWNTLRKHADLVVIDAPAASDSPAALMTARYADTVVIVVAADKGDMHRAARLRDAIVAAGGRCAGVVYNKAAPQKAAAHKAGAQGEPARFVKATRR